MIGDLQQVTKRLQYAAVAFIIVIISGTIGYIIIGGNGTPVIDAFYMTAITISTIGFHEVIDLDGHPYGRVFTIIIAFSGFGVLTYLLSNLVALFIEGDIQKTFTKRKMHKEIDKMEGHFIICGLGRVGVNIAQELHATKRDFILADMDEELIVELSKRYDNAPYVSGDCTEDEFLESLGINQAHGVFITTGNDNINLVICITARQLNSGLKIVVRSNELTVKKKLIRAGADRVVSPNYIGGLRMASEMVRPTVTHFLDEMMRSEINQRLDEVIIPERFHGKKLEELFLNELKETIILAVQTDEKWQYNPPPDTELEEGMHVVLMTSTDERIVLEKHLQ